jgi:hypothetical protein
VKKWGFCVFSLAAVASTSIYYTVSDMCCSIIKLFETHKKLLCVFFASLLKRKKVSNFICDLMGRMAEQREIKNYKLFEEHWLKVSACARKCGVFRSQQVRLLISGGWISALSAGNWEFRFWSKVFFTGSQKVSPQKRLILRNL